MNIKKKFMAVIAAGILALSISPFALAVTPEPADNNQQAAAQQQVPAAGALQTASDTELSNNKYLTKGGAAFWFVFTVVLNTALSFAIGNRFYRISRKDNHVSSEIRALRKDIDEKFIRNIAGFAEAEVNISNNNESYADGEGIKMPDKQSPLREISSEEEERFRRWEEAQSQPRSERRQSAAPKSALKEELDEELSDVKRINRKNYQPKRDRIHEEDTPDDDLDATREIKLSGGTVKNKAKEILGDIFPFKED